MAHIINLATQTLITTQSKSKYYSPADEDAHLPDLASQDCDEVGLVQAITAKAWSSSQHKVLFNTIQEQNRVKALQLLLDMKVRWGSTFVMLSRAESQQKLSLYVLLVLTS